MANDTTVYDIGEVEATPMRPPALRATVVRPRPERPVAASSHGAPQADAMTYVANTLSLLLPGAGRLLRGEWTAGLFLVSSVGFLVALGWAVLETLARLDATLPLLALPREAGVWALGVVYAGLCAIHVGNLLNGAGEASAHHRGPHPTVAAIASAIVPGWGQLLNDHRFKAAAFVGGLWIVGASWILVSPPSSELLRGFDMHLPPVLLVFCSPVVRWTLPAVVWALAIYDAATGASTR